MAKIRLTCAVEAEGGKDDREADCFCFLARLQFRGARLAVGAAKARISYRLDQRRGLWGQHTKAGGADCVQKCWRGGASVGHPEWKPQRAVFVADDDQGIWIVENPEAVRNFPAAHVVLAGNFDSAKKTIHVEEITPAPQLGSPKCASDPDTSPYRTTGNRTQKHNLIVSCATSP